MLLNLLAVGDVVGEGGQDIISRRLRELKEEHNVHFTVVNGENCSGVGILPRQADRLFDAGADVITLGNHTWNRIQIAQYMEKEPALLRPHNYAGKVPGSGFHIFKCQGIRIAVMNLMGRIELNPNLDNPFKMASNLLHSHEGEYDIAVLDFHAEATSEKRAMGYFLDGRISAVWGTHTHVQTSDAQVLPGGTGYITDLGMTGPIDSVLGIAIEQSIGKFMGDLPERYRSPKGDCKMEGCIFEIDDETGACLGAEAIRIS